jgi:hypothetical protein
LDHDKLTIAGDGGSAAKVSFATNLATGATDAQASFVLDEAARALGWAPANIGGSIGVDLNARLAGPDLDSATSGRVWKVGTNGKVPNARSFLAALRDRSGDGLLYLDVQIEAKIARLTGYSGERIDDADVSLQLNARGLQQFSLVGGMGSGRITATLGKNRGGELTLETSDVPALLRCLDVYHSMVGGRGSLRASFERDQLRGQASVEEFILSGDVLLNKSAEVIREADGKVKQERRVDERFQKLTLDFVGGDSKIDIGNAILTGSSVGITFDGWIDLATQSVSIAGTYVPAYRLNSFFTSIPIVDTILGGGEDGLLD